MRVLKTESFENRSGYSANTSQKKSNRKKCGPIGQSANDGHKRMQLAGTLSKFDWFRHNGRQSRENKGKRDARNSRTDPGAYGTSFYMQRLLRWCVDAFYFWFKFVFLIFAHFYSGKMQTNSPLFHRWMRVWASHAFEVSACVRPAAFRGWHPIQTANHL